MGIETVATGCGAFSYPPADLDCYSLINNSNYSVDCTYSGDIIERINEIENLRDNWDGYGAKKFNSDFISRVRCFSMLMPYTPEIFPTANNSVQFEFSDANNNYLEIEFYDNGKTSVYSAVNNKEQTIDDVDTRSIKEIICEFMQS